MRLSQIEHFVAVVQTGSLRAAAQATGVSQPAVTKSIRSLEAELHVRLLQRNARGASPKPVGKAFLARARVVQAELRKAGEELEALRGGRAGSVAFGIAPAACMLIVPEAMLQFRRRHPRANVRIVEGVSSAVIPFVRDETLDFSVGQKSEHRSDGALRFKPLFQLPLAVVGRQGHALRAATSLRELSEAPWLVFYPVGTGALERAFRDAGAAMPSATVQCESYASALALLARTDTLGLIAPQMLTEPYAQRHLQRITVREPLPSPLIGMYLRADAPLTPAAAAMAQAVATAARRLAKAS
jgi:LysR family transcriptional regulator, regulator of abg operon